MIEFGVVEADVETIAAAGFLFGGVAAAALTAYQNVAEEIQGLGTPWGTDEPGSAFWAAYSASAESVLGNALQVGDQVDMLHKNSDQTAKSYIATEGENMSRTQGVTA